MQKDHFKVLTITDVIEEVNDVKLFLLKEENEKIKYKAGQYLTFILSGEETETRRSYSLASSPDLYEPLCIGVKRIDNGLFSRKLVDHAKPGNQLLTLGAGGRFILPDTITDSKQLFFFAAGSGIIPIYSMIKTALYKFPHQQIFLIYSNSSEASTIFLSELQGIEKQYAGRFTIEFIFSNTPNLIKAHLHADMISNLVLGYGKNEYTSALYYLCGPESYMRLCLYTLRTMDVPSENIRREIFHTRFSVKKIAPPDSKSHLVTILYGDDVYTFPVQYPLSILQAARSHGLVLPYSCDAGRCGNCLAVCEKGKVWMSNNEVLTDMEIAKGYMLTCTSFPVDGNATIRIT